MDLYNPVLEEDLNGLKGEGGFNSYSSLNSAPKPAIAKHPVLSDVALHGLAGEIVRTINPHTEADPAAVLVQLLAAFGCMIGRTAHFRIGGDVHYLKLNVLLVGATSSGRKGTSWSEVARIVLRADESFAGAIRTGLASGEGLIHELRDPLFKSVPIKEKRRIVDYQDEVDDPGSSEKRAFVIEPEFARVLKNAGREGNILSPVMRLAWDTDNLAVMTKTPTKATSTHISIVGHITQEELHRYLTKTDLANGFVNRFLPVASRRSKYLPDGGDLQEGDLNPLTIRLHQAVVQAQGKGQMCRSNGTQIRWREVYEPLSDGVGGVVGLVTSRGTAYVTRIACIYALLDGSDVVEPPHLEAALALWDYCVQSAMFIFGGTSANPLTDLLYQALANSHNGLSKTAIHGIAGRNRSKVEIDTALEALEKEGLIAWSSQKGARGRAKEMYFARKPDHEESRDNELNEEMTVEDSRTKAEERAAIQAFS